MQEINNQESNTKFLKEDLNRAFTENINKKQTIENINIKNNKIEEENGKLNSFFIRRNHQKSDIFNQFKTQENNILNRSNKYKKSDIFLSKCDKLVKEKSSEKFVENHIIKPYGATIQSQSEYIPKACKANFNNYSNNEYSPINPKIKNFLEPKNKIIEKFQTNLYYNIQSPISEFTHINRVFGSHANQLYNEIFSSAGKKVFNINSDVCDCVYKSFKSYQGLTPQPFTKEKFRNNQLF